MISAEACAEKIGHLRAVLEKSESAYNALTIVLQAKTTLLPYAERIYPAEKFAQMQREHDEMVTKADYAKTRLDVMEMTLKHVENRYEEIK